MTADQVISIAGERSTIPLELFHPKCKGPWPAVLVIHEILGLNADIRRIARRLADHGFLAGCPDLMADGSRLACVRSALESLRRGTGPQVSQLNAAVDALRARPDTTDGVVGFCMGGGFATLLATRARLGAAAVFYGDIRPSEELKNACPMVGGYGARDRLFKKKGERLKLRLAEYGIPSDIEIYPDAGHSYMNKTVPRALAPLLRPFMVVDYNESAAEDSWRRMLSFFDLHLREQPASGTLASAPSQ